jgi:hypothetical protein
MRTFQTNQKAVPEAHGLPNVDAKKPTHPTGTREACPTKKDAVANRDLWGSRLGCREGGRNGQQIPYRPADNPFASHCIEGLAYQRNGFGLDALRRRLESLGGRAAIVGPEGSGKTTLIEHLANALAVDSIFVTIHRGSAQPWRVAHAQLPLPVTPQHAVLVDGAEQLGSIAWFRLMWVTRRARFVVATLHRPGRLPTLVECSTDRDLLIELVAELAPTDAPTLTPGLEELFDRHQGNIRSCLRELYDVFAGRASFEC